MQRRIPRFVLGGLLACFVTGAVHADDAHRWWRPSERSAQRKLEEQLLKNVDPTRLRSWHDLVCEEPHPAGGEADERMIDKLAYAFADVGLYVERQDLWVFLCDPTAAAVSVVRWDGQGDADPIALSLQESAVTGDAASAHPDLAIGWNAYSGNGDVTAGVVYANYGLKADFEELAALGVDVRGKIVIARYGRSFRGFKVKFAEAAGAAGVILYTDPADSGYRKGIAYPEGGGRTGRTSNAARSRRCRTRGIR